MIIYLFDGTKEGLLCCLFESFTKKEKPILVTSNCVQPSFTTSVKTILTKEENSKRVENGLRKCGSITLLNKLFYVLRSCDEHKETIIFNVAYKCLEQRKNVTMNFADADVVLFCDLYKKIKTEVHRFKGFLRFQETESGALFSSFEPDNDVCDLLAPHFVERFGCPFIIFDLKRKKACLSDGKQIYLGKTDKPFTVFLSNKEKELVNLWQEYYQSVNILERKNLKQTYAYMPKRYFKNLPERKNF